MRFNMLCALIVSVGLSTSVFAANTHEHRRLVNVSGQGAVSVVPDAFTVSVVLEERGPVVSKLNQQMADRLASVVQFLLKSGVEEKHIQSMSVNLNPWYEHTPNGRQDKGFILSREVRVTSTALQSYDSLLDGILGRGVDRIQRFEFINLDAGEAYQQALIAAVQDAKVRAGLLAREMGVKLGNVITINESAGHSMPPVMATMRMKDEMSSSLPGQSDITATVSVSFELIEKYH